MIACALVAREHGIARGHVAHSLVRALLVKSAGSCNQVHVVGKQDEGDKALLNKCMMCGEGRKLVDVRLDERAVERLVWMGRGGVVREQGNEPY